MIFLPAFSLGRRDCYTSFNPHAIHKPSTHDTSEASHGRNSLQASVNRRTMNLGRPFHLALGGDASPPFSSRHADFFLWYRPRKSTQKEHLVGVYYYMAGETNSLFSAWPPKKHRQSLRSLHVASTRYRILKIPVTMGGEFSMHLPAASR